MKPREPYIETRLQSWASWVRDRGRWMGWGSGIDRAALGDPGRSQQRMPGVYSDPTFWEISLMERDKQMPDARLHAHIINLEQLERRVLAARHVGTPMAVRSTVPHAEPPESLTVKDLERGPALCLLDYVWSGQQAWKDVALTVDHGVSTCRDAHFAATIRLQFKLEQDQSIRHGHFWPDGVPKCLTDAA